MNRKIKALIQVINLLQYEIIPNTEERDNTGWYEYIKFELQVRLKNCQVKSNDNIHGAKISQGLEGYTLYNTYLSGDLKR